MSLGKSKSILIKLTKDWKKKIKLKLNFYKMWSLHNT